MKALVALLVTVAVGFGIYSLTLKKMPTTDEGTASTQAISLTGVRGDLLQIAQSERANIALESKCVSVGELISAGSLTMSRPERDGYVYEVNCAGPGEFQVVARHAPAPEGSPIRYPTLAIDSQMQVREIQ
jgi:hypothetical protein